MKSYSTYLFDVGGTLIKFDETRRAAAYAERAAQVGVSVPSAKVLAVLEALDQEIPERSRHVPLSLLSPTEQRAFWTDFWAEGFRQLGLQETDAVRFADELLDSVNGGNFQAVFDDVVPALDGLCARGKQLGVISNFSENCESLLSSLGLAKYFDFFIVSGILGIEKPDSRIFQAAIEASGKDVLELVYVGDSIFHDIEGARAVGMDAILVDRANRYAKLDVMRVRDLRELMDAANGKDDSG
ncbi:MAG TPA: HAD-IA family hydrolase [Anaerolineae bacterium]|nr:HAD-IA family hydrolase [Anaerolineae bacterium]